MNSKNVISSIHFLKPDFSNIINEYNFNINNIDNLNTKGIFIDDISIVINDDDNKNILNNNNNNNKNVFCISDNLFIVFKFTNIYDNPITYIGFIKESEINQFNNNNNFNILNISYTLNKDENKMLNINNTNQNAYLVYSRSHDYLPISKINQLNLTSNNHINIDYDQYSNPLINIYKTENILISKSNNNNLSINSYPIDQVRKKLIVKLNNLLIN